MLCFVAQVAMAQNIRVSGQVTGSEDGQPIPGATVIVKGTTTAAGTDIDGNYSLLVPSNATLEVRYVGMKNAEVLVGGRTFINIVMKPDALQASEVTVTAMGIRKQNRALGYATTTVKGDDIASTNTISPINALQGKVAGVNITTSGAGGVTTSPTITIRGAKSFSKNNSPIFVIDGIVIQNIEQSAGTVSSNDNQDALYGNQLKNFNPDDYESIVVLKGAAATSLYGSRGANGAIVITTKSGKGRKGVGIEASYTHEFKDTYAPPIGLQNTYGMGAFNNGYEGDYNAGWESSSEGMTNFSYGPKMDGRMMKQYYKGNDSPAEPFVAQPDNWKAFFQAGSYDNVSAAITGGNEHVNYRLSYGYTNMEGTMAKNDFSRHSLNFSTTGTINDIFSVDATIQYTNSLAKNPQFSSPWNWAWSPTMLTSYFMPRNVDTYWLKDNFYNKETYERASLPVDSGLLSPFNSILDNNQQRSEQTILARIALNAQIAEKVDANVAISFNDFQYFWEEKNYGSAKYREGGHYATNAGSNGQFNGMATVHYGDTFIDDKLGFDIRLQSEIYGDTRSSKQSKRVNGGLLIPGVFNFGNSKNPISASEMSYETNPRTNMTVGLAAVAELSWDNQIFVEVSARNDWVSTLLYPKWLPNGQNNYSVLYPSVNASWVFSDTFSIDPSIISFGKLRASYAQVGSGTSAYQTANGAGGYTQSNTGNPNNGDIITSNPNIGTMPNYDLKPELQKSFEVGADVRFLNDRLGFDFAWYHTNTVNQIIEVEAAPESGVWKQLINAGSIINQGWELQLDATPIQTADVRWSVSGNISQNNGHIAELAPGVERKVHFSKWGAMPAIVGYVGGPLAQVVAGGSAPHGSPIAYQKDQNKAHYGKQLLYYRGAYGNPNSVNVFSPMTTGSISNYYNDPVTGDRIDKDYEVLGNIEPDFIWGFNTNLSYKGFNFYMQIDGRQGGSVVSEVLAYAQSMGGTTGSLQGRDAEHGGVARENYKGDIAYDGVILDGVFGTHANNTAITSFTTGEKVNVEGMSMQEAVDAGHIQPMIASAHHYFNNGTSYAENYVFDLDYVALRNITLSYDFPVKWIEKIKLQSLRLSFSVNNVCYLYNGLPSGYNPESISNNNPLTPLDYSGVPFTRNYSLSVNLKF